MPFLHILFAIAVVTIWGGNFIAAKYQLFHLPPFSQPVFALRWLHYSSSCL